MKKIKNVDELRKLYNQYIRNKTIITNEKPNIIPYKPRIINELYAMIFGYFWMPCHLCGTKFGGHEWLCSDNHKGICPNCSLKKYNETQSFF